MTEYIEKSTVLKMIDGFVKDSRDRGFPDVDIFDINMMKKMINKIPTADVIPIVRCYDCKHFNSHEWKCESKVDFDFVCSYGERKD